MKPYDIEFLTDALASQETKLMYQAEVSSTMTLAEAQGLHATVVLTDHQTAGRGRYSRTWEDKPGNSILVTFTKVVPLAVLPQQGSLLLSHLFVLAVWQALKDPTIKLKWPNDLVIDGKKLGGVLLTAGKRDLEHQAILLGVGINVIAPHDEASGLPGLDRGAKILAINHTLDVFLADLGRIHDPVTRFYYDKLWQHAAYLVGKKIRVTHYGPNSDENLEGTVVSSPFGGYLQLDLNNGDIIDMKDYGHQAHIELL